MRCLTLADVFYEKGVDVFFIVSDNQSERLLCDSNYNRLILNTDWKKLDTEQEYEILKERVDSNSILIIDTYSVTNDYIKCMNKLFKTVVFDDLFKEYYCADIIINYNIYCDIFDYNARYGASTTKLLGDKYVPLRKQFREVVPIDRTHSMDSNISVLLICGGGDYLNTMFKILEYAKDTKNSLFKSIEWNVIVGKYNEHINMLEELAVYNSNIKLHVNVKNMAKMMNANSLCISAASTVLYECSAMMLPTIFYSVADDQIHDAECFGKNRGMIFAGDFRTNEESTKKNILENLDCVINEKSRYENLLKESKNSVCRNGAENVVEEILKMR